MRKLSIYVHFPFCVSRCHYCDFVSNTCDNIPYQKYLSALALEWELRAPLAHGAEIVSVYIGGGTPSLWPSRDLDKLLSLFSLAAGIEITVEVNPGDAKLEWFEDLNSMGVTRFSLGAQAFDDERLRWLGRRHSIRDTQRAVQSARKAGAKAVSLDLIFGTPGQTIETLDEELDRLVALDPEHVSLYELTVAEQTRLGQWVRDGRVKMPLEDDLAAMWVHIGQRLARHDFERYEVSNYARVGHMSVHNMRYWQGETYLALGLGAHGFIQDGSGRLHRYMNTIDLGEYLDLAGLDGAQTGVGPGGLGEMISSEQHAVEVLMMGLRTSRGVHFPLLENLLDKDVFAAWQNKVSILVERDLLKHDQQFWRPTAEGMIVADGLVDFIIS